MEDHYKLPPDTPLLVTQAALAKMLGYSRSTMWRLIRAGVVVPEFGYGKAARFHPPAVLNTLLTTPKTPAPAPHDHE